MTHNAVMRGSWCYQCHLLNTPGSLRRAEDKTCSRRTTSRLMPSASRNHHGKRTKCAGKGSCRALFSPRHLYACIILCFVFSKRFVTTDFTIWVKSAMTKPSLWVMVLVMKMSRSCRHVAVMVRGAVRSRAVPHIGEYSSFLKSVLTYRECTPSKHFRAQANNDYVFLNLSHITACPSRQSIKLKTISRASPER